MFIRIVKRVSAIIDSRDSIKEEDLETYEIPENGVCIPSYLNLNDGPRSDYCTKLRNMLVTVGPEIDKGTGKTVNVITTEQNKNDNIHILNANSLPVHSSSQPSVKQLKSQSNSVIQETNESHRWRDMVEKSRIRRSKSTPNMSR